MATEKASKDLRKGKYPAYYKGGSEEIRRLQERTVERNAVWRNRERLQLKVQSSAPGSEAQRSAARASTSDQC